MKQKGLFWHCHHDRLVEYCYSYDERVAFIKENKPAEEQEVRLRLFQPVKGKLPAKVVAYHKACDKTWAAYYKACAAYHKAWAAYYKAWAAYHKACTACDKARAAYDKACAACDKAIEANMPAIIALHKKEQPDCPWNGKTLFPEKENHNG